MKNTSKVTPRTLSASDPIIDFYTVNNKGKVGVSIRYSSGMTQVKYN